MDVKSQSKKTGELGRRLLEKALMPIVAAAGTAAASYAAKKAPQVLDEKVVPKLRGLVGGAKQDLPARAKSMAGGAGEVAEQLTQRVTDVVGTTAHGGPANDRRSRTVSTEELERRRREREKHRSARRKASR
jgi:hypothetical protein